ncbi:MAG: GerAB/ArcD/ProY family transporter [Clostridium sp.]
MDKLSSKHFFFLILGVTTISITSYSSIFIKLGGRDSWLYALLGCIIITILYMLMLKNAVRFTDKSVNDLFEFSLGSIIGKLALLIFSMGAFITSVESVSSNAMNIHTNLFIESPVWFTLLILLLPCIYILTRRFNTFLILTLISVTFTTIGNILLAIVIQKYCDYTNLLPIMKNSFSLDTIILILGNLGCVTLTLPFLINLKPKDGIYKHSLIALVISSLIIVASFLSVIGTFGPFRASNIYFPEFIASQRAQIAGFMEFGELFYIYKSITGWLLKYILSYFCIYTIFKHRIKNRFTFAYIYTALVFIASFLITKNGLFFFYLLSYLNYVNIIPLICVPFIVYSFLFFRK